MQRSSIPPSRRPTEHERIDHEDIRERNQERAVAHSEPVQNAVDAGSGARLRDWWHYHDHEHDHDYGHDHDEQIDPLQFQDDGWPISPCHETYSWHEDELGRVQTEDDVPDLNDTPPTELNPRRDHDGAAMGNTLQQPSDLEYESDSPGAQARRVRKEEIGPTDVMCRRVASSRQPPGNILFEALVSSHTEMLKRSPGTDIIDIASSSKIIVDIVRERKGRFLMKSTSGGDWFYDIGDQASIRKTHVLIRDRLKQAGKLPQPRTHFPNRGDELCHKTNRKSPFDIIDYPTSKDDPRVAWRLQQMTTRANSLTVDDTLKLLIIPPKPTAEEIARAGTKSMTSDRKRVRCMMDEKDADVAISKSNTGEMVPPQNHVRQGVDQESEQEKGHTKPSDRISPCSVPSYDSWTLDFPDTVKESITDYGSPGDARGSNDGDVNGGKG